MNTHFQRQNLARLTPAYALADEQTARGLAQPQSGSAARTKRLATAAAVAVLCSLGAMQTAHAQPTGGISFSFNFLDAAGVGFNDPTQGVARTQALYNSANQFSLLFSTYFSTTGSVSLNVSSEVNPTSSTLASAGSLNTLASGAPAGFNLGEVVRTKLQPGLT